MKRAARLIFWLVAVLAVGILAAEFFLPKIERGLNLGQRAGVRVESSAQAQVFLDGQMLGQSPFQSDDLKPGIGLLELKAEGGKGWAGYVEFGEGTVTVVNRDLAETSGKSSGEVVSLERGSGVAVLTNPSGALVSIDSENVGFSPILISALTAGEHVLVISKDGYLTRSIRAASLEGYRLKINVDLALAGVSLAQVGEVTLENVKEVVVGITPTGFLRVRASASTGASQIGQVNTGDVLTLLEERPGWFKVRLVNGKEGYISAEFAKKKI